jgi:hypothetical protein
MWVRPCAPDILSVSAGRTIRLRLRNTKMPRPPRDFVLPERSCSGVIGCPTEADVNQSGSLAPTCDEVTISDISILIDYLFITGPSLGLPDCL